MRRRWIADHIPPFYLLKFSSLAISHYVNFVRLVTMRICIVKSVPSSSVAGRLQSRLQTMGDTRTRRHVRWLCWQIISRGGWGGRTTFKPTIFGIGHRSVVSRRRRSSNIQIYNVHPSSLSSKHAVPSVPHLPPHFHPSVPGPRTRLVRHNFVNICMWVESKRTPDIFVFCSWHCPELSYSTYMN